MPDYDELLQQKILELETGQPLEAVLNNMPGEASELEGLVRLAAAVREVPHPEPTLQASTEQRQRVLNGARRPTWPTELAHRSAQGQALPPAATRRSLWRGLTTGLVLAGVSGMALFLGLVLTGLGLWISHRAMDSARVEGITGQVQVATDLEGTKWKNISTGYRLFKGSRLRTLGASSASLVFFEGTRTTVAADSDLSFVKLDGSLGQSLQVEIAQNHGQTANQVVPLKGKKSFFLVDTPSGQVSVHGTIFDVRVSEGGQSRIGVTKGVVRVSSVNNQVTLLAGQATSALPSGEIDSPNYQFAVQGSLIAIQEDLWTVSGLEFQVTANTQVTGEPQLGDTITVTGRILGDGSRIADSIQIAPDSDQSASFTGTLESMEGESWTISGAAIQVTAETELDANLQVGDPVKVTFNLLDDGTWLALRLESLVERPEEPDPTPTATADPSAMPGYAFTPDELAAGTCGDSAVTVTGTLRNTATEAKDVAANVQLSYLIDRGGEYVESVELSPSNFERIDPGQSLTFGVQVTLNEQWSGRSMEGDETEDRPEIKLRVFIASATNRPDHLTGRLTVTITADCKVTPTPTLEAPAATPTHGTGTPTLEGTPTATAEPSETAETNQCTGATPHPTGMKLAQRYGVPYTEIMYWFCRHYGFGEIDLAYSLSRQTGKPVAEIFAMRASGLGWGQIKKDLSGDKKAPNSTEDDTPKNKNGKGNGNKGGKQ